MLIREAVFPDDGPIVRALAEHALLEAAVSHARTWSEVRQVVLGVSEVAGAARRLYESAGFKAWGREPRALEWQGRFTDEIHMVLEI